MSWYPKKIRTAQGAPAPAQDPIQSNMSNFQQMIIKALLNNSQQLAEYVINPSQERAYKVAESAVRFALQNSADLFNMGFVARALPVEQILNNFPGAKQLMTWATQWIIENMNIGEIPDDISSQSELLAQYDLPDSLAQQFGGAIQQLRQRYPNNPEIYRNFMIILLRIKDDSALVNTQLRLFLGQ